MNEILTEEVGGLARKIAVEDLFSFQLAGDPQVSPSGDRVAFVVSRINREENATETAIYMAAPGSDPVRFTSGENDGAPRFSPDGQWLGFISRRSGQPQVWVISLAGGEARQVTRVQGGVREFAWAPSGRRLAFTAMLDARGIRPEVKEEREEDLLRKFTKGVKTITEQFHKMDGEGYYGDARPCLCVIALEEGAEPVQLTQPPYRVAGVAWAPDNETILFSGRLGPDYDREALTRHLYAISAKGGEARQLTPPDWNCGGASVSPDGQLVAFVMTEAQALGYDNPVLAVVPLVGGEVRTVAVDWDRPFATVGLSDLPAPGAENRPVWAPDGRSLYALSSINGTCHLVRVDVATGKVEQLTSGDRYAYAASLDAACRTAVLAVADPLNPGDLYWYDVGEGTEQRLTELNGALLAELELSEPCRIYARAGDGPQVDGWVMKPHGFVEGQQYPTILEIHGGPMAMYASAFFFEFQLLAAQGYGVIYSNPRGSLGYGGDFCAAIRGRWGSHDYADLMAIVDQALAENDWMDAGRLGVTGGSYGGYMTNWIVSHTDRFRAAVTGRSIADWRSMIGSGDGGARWIQNAGGVPPWADDAWYKQQSPITYVENVRTPILIEHQEGDLRCPIDQAMLWFTAIKYLGKAPVRFVSYPDEFHGMSRNGKPWNRVHRLNEIVTWFDTYL